MVDYRPRGKAAKLAQVDVSYLEKLTKAGELDCYAEKSGKQKKWFVNIECPRFQKLLSRLQETGKKSTDTVTNHPVDWDEWEKLCRMGNKAIVKRRCSDDTITSYRYWTGRFFTEYRILGRESLMDALYQYEKNITAQRDYYASRHFLYRAVMTIARYYVYKGYESQAFVEGLKALRPEKAIETVKRYAHTPEKISGALTALQTAKTKKGGAAYSEYDALLNRTLIIVTFMTGARNSEVCNIRLQDINWREGQITLYGKGGKIRPVGLHDVTKRAIREYLAVRPSIGSEDLFLWKRGEESGKMNRRYFSRRMARLVKYVDGVDRLNPHMLRAAAITEFFRMGLSADTIRDAVGHAELSTTNIYAQPTVKDIVDATKGVKCNLSL